MRGSETGGGIPYTPLFPSGARLAGTTVPCGRKRALLSVVRRSLPRRELSQVRGTVGPCSGRRQAGVQRSGVLFRPRSKSHAPLDYRQHERRSIVSIIDIRILGDKGVKCMKPTDLIQGMLDLLILRTLQVEARHGWAIAHRISEISNEELQVQQGSLYPALHRLEARGWIRSEWGSSDKGPAREILRAHAHRARTAGA